MAWPLGESVIWHRYDSTTRDADNNKIPGYDDVPLTGVTFYPLDGTELIERGDLVHEFGRLVFMPPITAGPRDEFTVLGERWESDGPAVQYRSSLTGTKLTSIVIKRTTG